MRTALLFIGLLFSLASWGQQATSSKYGVVKVGAGLGVSNGVISLNATITTLPQGTLVDYGTIKHFYATSTVNSSSECTLNLTLDNTTTGAAMFSHILYNDSQAIVNVNSSTDAVGSVTKSEAANLKTTTHYFYKGNSAVLGALFTSFNAAPTGTPVRFFIVGK